MRNIEKARAYYAQPVEVFFGSAEDPRTCVKRFAESGVHFREAFIDTGKGGDVVEIDQITDIHFNKVNDADLSDPELAYTHECRVCFPDGATLPSCQRAMEAAMFADQVVITGDTLDFLSRGAIEMTHEHIWKRDPDALIAIGGHDVTKQMQTGRPNELSVTERLAFLQQHWRHDLLYASKEVGGKAIVVTMFNDQAHYWEEQAPKLAADIARAREQGMAVLIFQHEPIPTGNPEDTAVLPFIPYYSKIKDFYNAWTDKTPPEFAAASEAVYRLITENADVVRGVFCGHLHSAYYTEIRGSYVDADGVRREKFIPQHLLEGNLYDNQCGHIFRIYVK